MKYKFISISLFIEKELIFVCPCDLCLMSMACNADDLLIKWHFIHKLIEILWHIIRAFEKLTIGQGSGVLPMPLLLSSLVLSCIIYVNIFFKWYQLAKLTITFASIFTFTLSANQSLFCLSFVLPVMLTSYTSFWMGIL